MYHGLTHTIHKRLTEYLDLEDSQITEVVDQLKAVLGPALNDDTADVYTEDYLSALEEEAAAEAYYKGYNEALEFARDIAAGTPAEQDVQDIYAKLYKQ